MPDDQEKQPTNFAIIGCGYIFDRHVDAIKHIGGKLLCASDIDLNQRDKIDSETEFYTTKEQMADSTIFEDVDWVVIATPNHTHFEMIQFFTHRGKNVLCEKPLALSKEQLKEIEAIKEKTGQKIFVVQQLRFSEELQNLKKKLEASNDFQIGCLDINMHRGSFYFEGWKGDNEKSGGLLFNIGVHYFDLMCWFFGEPTGFSVTNLSKEKASGTLGFNKTAINWSLNIVAPKDKQFRNIVILSKRINLTNILENLHRKVYEALEEGEGLEPSEVSTTIGLLERMSAFYETK